MTVVAWLTWSSVSFGRAPVRTVFYDALGCLKENQDLLKPYVTHELSLEDAAKGYELFEKKEARKVILRVQSTTSQA